MHHSVGQVAKIARVTVRLLHHYDEIGLLLVPRRRTDRVNSSGSTNSPPARGIRLTFAAHGADLDMMVAQARAIGSTVGGTVAGPSATPWNTRDVLARDPDGYEVVFTSALPVEAHDPEFAERMEQVKRQVLHRSP